MRRFSIVCSIVLLVVIGATAAIVAQRAVAASSGNDKAVQAAGQEADAVAAQKGLVLDSIAKGDMVTAEAACRALLNAPTPHAFHEIVEQAKALDKLPEVHQLYQNMIATRPGDPQVIWLKTGLAIANVHLADDKAVEAMLQNIAAGHGSDDRAAEAFGQVAWAYRKGQQYDKALSINQYTVDHWPQKDRAAYAHEWLTVPAGRLGRDYEESEMCGCDPHPPPGWDGTVSWQHGTIGASCGCRGCLPRHAAGQSPARAVLLQ